MASLCPFETAGSLASAAFLAGFFIAEPGLVGGRLPGVLAAGLVGVLAAATSFCVTTRG